MKFYQKMIVRDDVFNKLIENNLKEYIIGNERTSENERLYTFNLPHYRQFQISKNKEELYLNCMILRENTLIVFPAESSRLISYENLGLNVGDKFDALYPEMDNAIFLNQLLHLITVKDDEEQ